MSNLYLKKLLGRYTTCSSLFSHIYSKKRKCRTEIAVSVLNCYVKLENLDHLLSYASTFEDLL